MKYPRLSHSSPFAVAILSLLASGAGHTADYTWANSNVAGTPTTPLNWVGATQGTWTGGTPASSNLNTIQFFADTSTALTYSGDSAQTSNIDTGGAFELATLTLSGKAATSGILDMTLSGSALNFSATTGTINFSSQRNGDGVIGFDLNPNIQLGKSGGGVTTLALGGDGTGNFRMNGIISQLDPGAKITKSGASTVGIGGANSYTGTTTITGGTLQVWNTLALGTTDGGTIVGSASTLDITKFSLASSNTVIGNEPLSLIGTGAGSAGALTNSSGDNEYQGRITLTGATLISSAGSSSLNLSSTQTFQGAGFALTVGGSGSTTLNSVLEGAGTSLTKKDSGTLTLTKLNTYTGTTAVQVGKLVITHTNALGGTGVSSGTSVSSGAALELQGGISVPTGEGLTLSGTGLSDGGALRNISGDNIYGGIVTLGATTARINSDSGLLTLSNTGSITGPSFSTLTVGGSGNTKIDGTIDLDAGNLIKDGAGKVTLTGLSIYDGPTRIDAGVLSVSFLASVSFDSNIGTGATLSFNGGTLQYTGASVTVDRGFAIGSGKLATIEVTQSGSNLRLNGAATGNFGTGLDKTGAGTLTLGGSNTFRNGTTVSEGTLNVAGTLTQISNTVTVKNGATLKGTGSIAGNTTIESGGTHAPGNSPGVETFTGTVTYKTGSIFEWELNSNTIAGRGTAFDGVDVTNTNVTIEAGAIFKLVMLPGVDFNNVFWNIDRKWQVFGTGLSGISFGTNFTIDASGANYTPYHPYGSFAYDNTVGTLNWTAVPEPTSALAGLLVGAGLLRRKRGRKG
jgi:autotransporter-associated beta strand protein